MAKRCFRVSSVNVTWPCRSIASTRTGIRGFKRFPQIRSEASHYKVIDPSTPVPKITWVHWVLYNLPPTSNGLAEGVKADAMPAGTMVGLNGWKRAGYNGPCGL